MSVRKPKAFGEAQQSLPQNAKKEGASGAQNCPSAGHLLSPADGSYGQAEQPHCGGNTSGKKYAAQPQAGLCSVRRSYERFSGKAEVQSRSTRGTYPAHRYVWAVKPTVQCLRCPVSSRKEFKHPWMDLSTMRRTPWSWCKCRKKHSENCPCQGCRSRWFTATRTSSEATPWVTTKRQDYFDGHDVVRHKLVQDIIKAYEKSDEGKGKK